MSTRHDWYRRSTWSAADACDFEQRLSRSRSQRAQYLHIQAGHLAETCKARLAGPAIALASRCLEEDPNGFFEVSAHLTIAKANGTLGNKVGALEAYRAAVKAEARQPGRYCAYLEYAWFAVTNDLTDAFGDVLDAMESMEEGDLAFPIAQYKYFASLALISNELGDVANARRMARNAVEAETRAAPFARHKDLGIVRNVEPAIQKLIRRLAA